MTDLHTLSISELREKLASGALAASGAVMACLERIAETEPALNALITLCAEEAGMRPLLIWQAMIRRTSLVCLQLSKTLSY